LTFNRLHGIISQKIEHFKRDQVHIARPWRIVDTGVKISAAGQSEFIAIMKYEIF
jgi:hypothetical protein